MRKQIFNFLIIFIRTLFSYKWLCKKTQLAFFLFLLFYQGIIFSLFKSTVLWIFTNMQAKSRYRPVTTPQKFPHDLAFSPSPLTPVSGNWFDFCPHSFAFSRASYEQNPIAWSLLSLPSFTYHDAPTMHICIYAYLHICIYV